MSAARDRNAMRVAERAHERARQLASESIDEALSRVDSAWLAEHLLTCDDCRGVAAEYQALHDELRGLEQPQPPRDLWARTSAALDQVDASRTRKGVRPLGWAGFFSGSRASLATVAAVGFTVLLAVASLFSNGPLHVGPGATDGSHMPPGTVAPVGGAEVPVAFVGNNGYWVKSSEGVYQITSSSAECDSTSDRCTVTNGGGGKVLGSITSNSNVSVVLTADAGTAAVWTTDKVVVLPLGTSSDTVSIDKLTPRPVSPTPVATPSESGAAPSATAPASPEATPGGSSSQPTAILDGYTVVGRAPEFSSDGTWLAFAARPADMSTGPDIFVWRNGWDRAKRVTATGSDYFAGWFGGLVLITEFAKPSSPPDSGANASATPEEAASPTAAPKAPAPSFISFVYDPRTGSVQQIDRPMLLPAVDPTGQFVVYWSGTAQLNRSTGLWEPLRGDLYFDSLADFSLLPGQFGHPTDPSVQPDASATPVPGQLLPVASSGAVTRWLVRWDSTGSYVAVWVGSSDGDDSGRVSLYAVDRAGGRVDTSRALLSAVARSNLSFDGQNLIYTSPSKGGDGLTYIVAIPKSTPVATGTVPTATPVPSSPAESPAPAKES